MVFQWILSFFSGDEMAKFHSGDCASVLLRKVSHPEKYFYFKSGAIARSLKELESLVSNMPNEIFQEHVNTEINDFAIWVKDVVGDRRLAKHLEAARTKKEITNLLKRRVSWLEKRARL